MKIMINMNQKFVAQYLKGLVDEKLQDAYDMEYGISVDSVDELNDLLIESEDICQIDAVYYALYAMLPSVYDEVVDYLDEALDYDDCWGTLAMRETIGLCD